MLNNGNWNGQKILSDQNYIKSMITPSQELNKSYGLLWWLNGQPSFMLPGSQFVFNGSLIPNAPNDTWCALGKNDQKIYIVPSEKLVIIRMGQDGGQITGALSSFDNLFWEKLNDVFCFSSADNDHPADKQLNIFPNPFMDKINVQISDDDLPIKIELFDSTGKMIFEGNKIQQVQDDIFTALKSGIYFIKIQNQKAGYVIKKVIKM
jgi:hypothetical protein